MIRHTLTRRRMLGQFAAGTALAVAAPRIAFAAEKEISVQIWGSTWTGSVSRVAALFEEREGIKVNLVTQSSAGEGLVKLQSMRAKPAVDVWFTTSALAARAQQDEGLFLPLPYDRIPAAAAIEATARSSHWAGLYSYPMGIAYLTHEVDEPITAWEDLWEDRFAQSICAPAMGQYQGRMLAIAAMINGGDLTNVDPGFAALKQLRGNVVSWYSSDTTARKGIAQGEYSVLVTPPAGYKMLLDNGIAATFVAPKPAPMTYDAMMLVNTPRQEAAARFIDFCLTEEIQNLVAQAQGMGAVHPAARSTDEIQAVLPKPEDRVGLDETLINAKIGDWNERFNREVVS
ncbi:ABC transporter substrate-binding protein [Haematobacter genomosp. 1]|uniref:ABC transporter substrate-binding protein n=1 Tax=Haematobacter genomosp. 1 TaxID=366618 RepID=A0A212AAG1_9RHOB|nr:extracellular solute-binding protein [Haematobacter genomosp. 1]OWJ77148.1 hypothetical protein CDV49_12070 [Haematobacter genomosp. 1]